MSESASRMQRWVLLTTLVIALLPFSALASRDLEDVIRAGELRHIGIPYANFVTGSGDGLDVELIRGFAAHLGVDYRFVPSTWASVFGDLTGRHARRSVGGAERYGDADIRGDLVANGMTILDWRQQVVAFSDPTFPSGVWLIAPAESPIRPIAPSGDMAGDIVATKSRIDGFSVLALANTCLDPTLYQLEATRAEVRLAPAERKLNEMVPALLNADAQTTLLDVPDALVALERWPGEIKVIGPISGEQRMGVAFRPDSPRLREAFNTYLAELRADGRYAEMVSRYFPAVFAYFPEFFGRDGGR